MTARIKGLGCEIEVQGEDIKELMRNVSNVQECMGARVCGMCGETEKLRFRARRVKEFEFFGIYCETCKGELSFGERKDKSGLFPKEWSRYEGQGSGDAY